MLNYFVISIIPLMIFFIILIGVKEKKDIFKLFTEGAIEGIKIVYKIFPFILAITVAIGLLKSTGAMEILLYPIKPILQKCGIPKDIVPLCILRPLSGGASMSIVMDIFKTAGPDSRSGKMASIIMAATETTLYTITILFGAVGIKKMRGVLIAGLIADTMAIITAIILVNIGFL
ncbi:MAG: nucleoside recognition domain-containing protein [Clostridia bacterium]